MEFVCCISEKKQLNNGFCLKRESWGQFKYIVTVEHIVTGLHAVFLFDGFALIRKGIETGWRTVHLWSIAMAHSLGILSAGQWKSLPFLKLTASSPLKIGRLLLPTRNKHLILTMQCFCSELSLESPEPLGHWVIFVPRLDWPINLHPIHSKKSHGHREDVAHLSQDGKKKIKGRSPIFEVGSEGRFWLFWWQCLVVKWYLGTIWNYVKYQISYLDICHTLPNKSYISFIDIPQPTNAHQICSLPTIQFSHNFGYTKTNLVSSTSASPIHKVVNPKPDWIVTPQKNPNLGGLPGYVTRIQKKHPTCNLPEGISSEKVPVWMSHGDKVPTETTGNRHWWGAGSG